MLAVHTSLHHLPSPNRVMGDYICCFSGAFNNSGNPSISRKGPVVVFIDNAIVSTSGMEFEYRDDPVYSSASPQMIIPA